MEFKTDHFSTPNISGYQNNYLSSTPPTTSGGDMSIPFSRHGGVGNLALDRRKQINTLLIFNENVTELVPNVQYRMDFTGGGSSGPLTMLIHLPPGFPKEKPSIKIEPLGLQHSWIDIRSGNVIGSPGLNNFSAHSDLGRVVQVIKREFELKPPISTNQIQTVQSNTNSYAANNTGWLNDQTTQHTSNSSVGNSTNAANSSYYSQARNSVPNPVSSNAHPYPDGSTSLHSNYKRDMNTHNHIPHNPGASTSKPEKEVIPEVAALTDSELKELNDNESALLNFCHNLENPMMETMEDNHEKLAKEIQSICEVNETLTNALRDKKESLVNKQKDYDEQRANIERVRERNEKAQHQHSITNLYKMLEKCSVSEEEESEKCADNFLNGESNIEEFIKEYTAIRTSHFKKKAKLDSVMQQKNLELKGNSAYVPSWPKY